MSDQGQSPGPVDGASWPEQLVARAVDGSRLFGYDVENDLAHHYRFSDILFLSLTGDLPDDVRSRSFEIALAFASCMTIGRAPIHAAMLSRLCGARPGGVLSIAALSLGEDAENVSSRIDEVLAAMGALTDGSALPDDLRAKNDDERRSVGRLRELLHGFVAVPVLELDPSLDVALVEVLRASGLDSTFSIVTALAIGRLSSAVAEARTTKLADFRSYPMNTPRFVYEVPQKE